MGQKLERTPFQDLKLHGHLAQWPAQSPHFSGLSYTLTGMSEAIQGMAGPHRVRGIDSFGEQAEDAWSLDCFPLKATVHFDKLSLRLQGYHRQHRPPEQSEEQPEEG